MLFFGLHSSKNKILSSSQLLSGGQRSGGTVVFLCLFLFHFPVCSNIMLAAYALQQTLIAATAIVPRSQSGAPGE